MLETYSDLKKYIPTLEVVLTNNSAVIYLNGKIILQTSGPQTIDIVNSYLSAMSYGFLEGMKYTKDYLKSK